MLINVKNLKKNVKLSHELKVNNVNKKKKSKMTRIKKKFKDAEFKDNFNIYNNNKKKKEKKFNKKLTNVKRSYNNNAQTLFLKKR